MTPVSADFNENAALVYRVRRFFWLEAQGYGFDAGGSTRVTHSF